MTGFASLDLTYPTPTRVVVRIDASDVDGRETDRREFAGAFPAPSTDLLDSEYALMSVLADEEALLLRFADWRLRLRARPRDSESVQLSVADYSNTKISVPVTKAHLCETFITAGRTYLERLRNTDDDDECYRTALTVGIDDLEHRMAYYRDHGTLDEYEPTIDGARMETFVFDCRRNDRLAEFVVETNALAEFVRNLRRCDDEYATEAYQQLLQWQDDITERVLKILRNMPDGRAVSHLKHVAWSKHADQTPLALEALSTTDRDAAFDAGLTLLSSDDTDSVVAAARLFANVGAEGVDAPYRSRIEAALDRAAEDADGQIKDELETAADRFRS